MATLEPAKFEKKYLFQSDKVYFSGSQSMQLMGRDLLISSKRFRHLSAKIIQ